jgi:hypothetical protein
MAQTRIGWTTLVEKKRDAFGNGGAFINISLYFKTSRPFCSFSAGF